MEDDVLGSAAAWRARGHPVALATVVKTWGSSPRPAGSLLAVDHDGHFVGSVSGGCVENAVVTAAAEVLAGGDRRVLEFGVTNEQAWEVGLACGGRIQVLVEPLGDIDPVLAARAEGRAIVVATDLATGERRFLDPWTDDAPEAAWNAARSDLSHEQEGVLWQIHNPPLRLVIVGAVHIAQHLAPMAARVGYAVTVVDPRRSWASPERFPSVDVLREWPQQAFERLRPGRRTAIVTLTHDAKLDDPALSLALRSDAFYVGALGSTRTRAGRNARLAAAGFTEAEIGRIHGPVGLDIGARSPAEIAVSILAQMIATLRLQAP